MKRRYFKVCYGYTYKVEEHLNDSETQERGLEGVKIQKISWGSMPPDPPRSFSACLGNRSVFILDPRLFSSIIRLRSVRAQSHLCSFLQ